MAEITVTTTHKLSFTVKATWGEEGGIGEETYGKPHDNLNDAIQGLMEVRARDAKRVNTNQPDELWHIRIDVTTTTKSK